MYTQSLTLTLTLTVTLVLTKTLVCASIKLLSEVRGGQKVPKLKTSGIFFLIICSFERFMDTQSLSLTLTTKCNPNPSLRLNQVAV